MAQEIRGDTTIEAFALVNKIVKDTGISLSAARLRTLIEAVAHDLGTASYQAAAQEDRPVTIEA